jgi:DNA-binding CsgD family transcriptional regulator
LIVSERTLPAAAAVAGRGVFVGRAGELAVLEAAAAASRRGQPQVVLVEGEAGVGKSTLLARFASGLAGAAVLRASGDEAELLLPYGIVSQLTASARGTSAWPGLLAADLSDGVDPLAVGADLVTWLDQVGRGQQSVLVLVDDLQWADRPSARALLFAVRRLHADRVLVVAAARPGELARLGEGWQRFLAGDHRAGRVRLGGLAPEEVAALGRALGAEDMPRRAVSRLLEETGGNPLYCRAMLEEAATGVLGRDGGTPQVPRSLAGLVLARVGALSPAARQLAEAAAVLGRHCELAAAAALADLADPLPALGEAVAAGILAEQPGGAAAGVGFSHLLVQRAVYRDLSPARRRRLHQQAAGLVDRHRALGHRVAAAVGPDDRLAGELEAAAREARDLGRIAQAAAWLAQAAAASSDPGAADCRLLDALEILVNFGEVAQAQALAARAAAAGPGARRSWLLGALDFLAGRAAAAEDRLVEAWQAHDQAREASVGAAAATHLATLCLVAGRIPEAIRWAGLAADGAAPATVRNQALGVLAIALFVAGRGPEGLARLAFLPAAPSEVPRKDTDALALRGMARVLAEDLDAAVADLSAAAARLRAGIPLRTASQCLSYLAAAEYRLGSWDDAVVHAELAVSLAHDADRGWDVGLLHCIAAIVPSLRGDWETASAHIRMAAEAAEASRAPGAIAAAATARAFLAMARDDLEGVADAAAAVRATGKAEFLGRLIRYEWRSLEIDALIGLARLDAAETALTELEAAVSPAGPPSALVAAARLRGDLATAAGDQAAATAAYGTAWRRARGLRVPLALAQLEISDARRLRAIGQPQPAVARLRSARQRLITLGARPYAEICDRELAAAGAPAGPQTAPALPGLTPAEQAVARLVATGQSNRQTAAALYVSVKTVEFHLGHIFDKLGIRSRKDLIARIGTPTPHPAGNLGS